MDIKITKKHARKTGNLLKEQSTPDASSIIKLVLIAHMAAAIE